MMQRTQSDEETPATLYLTRNGLMEPLGQSQVLAYLRGLSRDFRISVVTFEKLEDLADVEGMARLREECARFGIRWLPQRFRHRPKVVSPALNMLHFAWLGLREVRGGARLIHARSYIPAAVALLLHQLTGVPFIFDMRALWPEELITAGRLRRGSMMHRAISWIERRCLADAAAVVSLTEVAVKYLREIYPDELRGKVVHVIPTCADIDRFSPTPCTVVPRRYGCNGTVLSGWFSLDWLATFYRAAAARDATARFEVVTRDDAAIVKVRLVEEGVPRGRLEVYGVPSSQMPAVVQRQSVSVMFYANGAVSELGRSPTRMAEVLGSGRPVVANAGVGDVARIVEHYRVGVLVRENSEAAITEALDELEILLSDPGLASRCRRAAEEVFSLKAGTEAYRGIYRNLIESETLTSSPAQEARD